MHEFYFKMAKPVGFSKPVNSPAIFAPSLNEAWAKLRQLPEAKGLEVIAWNDHTTGAGFEVL